mmetsp:Transcript_29301/g.52449  ORF Transcript_29301/g.52449 Transcript_29301/m.52449 type:complete len:388 (+) Transcript_29301:65-1228(+)
MEALVQLRHHIHKNPETAFQEFETAKVLKAYLVEAGYSEDLFVECANPGFYIDLQGTGEPIGEPKVVALRADMDALKMSEDSDLPYKSVNPKAAHMCGHDGHVTALVGVGRAIKLQQSLIPSNCKVRLFFQPAEEEVNGAKKMIEEGILEGVDEVYGCHNTPGKSLGILVCPDTTAAASAHFLTIRVKGRGGHGAFPERCQDVVLTACQITQALATITGRAISCHEAAVLTVCKITAGSAPNVFPNEAVLEGSLRTYSPEVLETVMKRIHTIVHSVAAASDCTAEIEFPFDCPPTVNHKENAEIVRRAYAKEVGPEFVIDSLPAPGSEDFAFYLQHRPGAMFGLYSGKPGFLHTSRFNFDDESLPFIIRAFLSILSDRFGTQLSLQL